MTAQIGIINKMGCVLASDSAASLSNSSKIFNTANKIYPLNRKLPVAFMVNGSSDFVDVPWSRVIDIYSEYISDKHFDYLEDYYHDFLNFLVTDSALITSDRSFHFFFGWCRNNILSIEKTYGKNKEDLESNIDKYIKSLEENEDWLVDKDKQDIVSINVENFVEDILSSKNDLECKRLRKLNLKDKVVKLLTLDFMKIMTGYGGSQIIIGGFGKKDIYPSIIDVRIEGFFDNKLRYFSPVIRKVGSTTLGSEYSKSHLNMYAQHDGADILLYGVENDILGYIRYRSREDDSAITMFIKNHSILKSLDEEDKKILINDIGKYSSFMRKKTQNSINNYCSENYGNPIMSTVNHMDLVEIAELARTLVNLTSIKRRYSINAKETVGGPVRVITITKDGILEQEGGF